MRRIVFGCLWFVLIWLGALGIGGAMVGGMAGAETPSAAAGLVAGHAAGQAFGEAYGRPILFASIGTAAIGTLLGWLPGTRAAARSA